MKKVKKKCQKSLTFSNLSAIITIAVEGQQIRVRSSAG